MSGEGGGGEGGGGEGGRGWRVITVQSWQQCRDRGIGGNFNVEWPS